MRYQQPTLPQTRAGRARVALLALALSASGCSGDNGTSPQPPVTPPTPTGPTKITLSTKDLVSGGTGTLTGAGLDRLPGRITIDDVDVPLTSQSDSRVTFTMPPARPCETDARSVKIRADTMLADSALLKLPITGGLSTMQIGETRELSLDDPALQCLQLPATKRLYLITLNTLAQDSWYRVPISIRSYGSGADTTLEQIVGNGPGAISPQNNAANGPSLLVNPFATRPDRASGPNDAEAIAWRARQRDGLGPRAARLSLGGPARNTTNPYQHQYTLFDPRMATAKLGDTINVVHWMTNASQADSVTCNGPREKVATARAEVYAMSPDSSLVVLKEINLRYNEANFQKPETRAEYAKAVARAAPLITPTMRNVFDPDWRPLATARGRMFVTITDFPNYLATIAGAAGQNTRTLCTYTSGVVDALFNSRWTDYPSSDDLSNYVLHEFGHVTGDLYDDVLIRGWSESWAKSAEEYAGRLFLGQVNGGAKGYPYPASDIPDQSIYNGIYGNAGGYGLAWPILLMAREKAGEMSGPGGTVFRSLPAVKPIRLANGLLDSTAYPAAVASYLGMSTDSMMLAAVMAQAAHDQVEPGQPNPFPAIRAWNTYLSGINPTDTILPRKYRGVGWADPEHQIAPAWNLMQVARMRGGSFHWWYVGTTHDAGVSLRFLRGNASGRPVYPLPRGAIFTENPGPLRLRIARLR